MQVQLSPRLAGICLLLMRFGFPYTLEEIINNCAYAFIRGHLRESANQAGIKLRDTEEEEEKRLIKELREILDENTKFLKKLMEKE